jgi:hypothetical protein
MAVSGKNDGRVEDEQEPGTDLLGQECYPGVDLKHFRSHDLAHASLPSISVNAEGFYLLMRGRW